MAKRPNGAGTVYRRADGRFEASWRATRNNVSERRHAYYHSEAEAWQRLSFELGFERVNPGTGIPETLRAALEAASGGDLSRVILAPDGWWLVGNSAEHAQLLVAAKGEFDAEAIAALAAAAQDALSDDGDEVTSDGPTTKRSRQRRTT